MNMGVGAAAGILHYAAHISRLRTHHTALFHVRTTACRFLPTRGTLRASSWCGDLLFVVHARLRSTAYAHAAYLSHLVL